VSPVSDTYLWLGSVDVDAAFRLFDEHVERLRVLIHEHDRDDPRRELWLAESFALLDLRRRMQLCLGVPVPEGTQRVGEGTDPNVRRMRHNRGPR
jgi:hypothetical protein